jgi:anthranilate 1,2-dioxygenase small subunit
MDAMKLWFEINDLQQRYVNALDNDRLEQWPEFFVEECRYEIIPKENVDLGLPVAVVYCRNRRMLRDRVLSLRHANIFEGHTYRHMTSGLVIREVDGDTVHCESNYIVIITGQAGESSIYQAGVYHDEVIRVDGQWRYLKKRVIFDTSRVPTLLATPI